MFSYSDSGKVLTKKQHRKDNKSVGLDFLVGHTKSNEYDGLISKIREVAKDGFEYRRDKEILSKKLRKLKLNLPYFIFSGTCKIHHSDETLDYNSFLQIDIDFKYQGGAYYAKLVKYKLARFPFVVMAAFSPTGYGVRVLVKTSNFDKSLHLESSKQVANYISKSLDIDIKNFDFLGASQPSFITVDKDLYYTNSFSDFEVDEKKATQKSEFSGENFDIKSIDKSVFDIAKRYAFEQTKNGFVDGNKYLYVSKFSIACNLLGVSYSDAIKHVLSNCYHLDFTNVKSNPVLSVYRKYKEVFKLWSYKLIELNKQYVTKYEGWKGAKLTEVLEKYSVPLLKNSILISPTGTGKTWYIAHLKHRRIIFVPMAKMVSQVAEKYNATPYYADKKGDIIRAEFIVTTYASAENVSKILSDANVISEFYAYVDESHNLTVATAANYQLSQLTGLVDFLPKYKQWVLVTGTDIYNFHPFFEGVPKVVISIPKPIKSGRFIYAKDPLRALCDEMMKSIVNGRFPLVLYNNKSKVNGLVKLKAMLLERMIEVLGVETQKKIEFFNADEKESFRFKEFSKTSEFYHKTVGCVATTILKEAISVDNNYHFDCFAYGNFHPIEHEQFYNRPRHALSITVTIIKPIKKDLEIVKQYNFNPYRYKTFLEKQCDSRILELNSHEAYCYEDDLILERNAYNYLNALPLKNENSKYAIDWLNFNNAVFEQEKKFINSNESHLVKYLEQFNIVFDGKKDEISELKIGAELEKKLNIEKKIVKKTNLSLYNEVVKRMENNEDVLMTLDKFRVDIDTELTKIEKTAYNRYLKFKKLYVDHAKAIEFLEKCGTSDGKFKALIKQITVFHLQSSKEYMSSNRRFSIVLKSIESHFEVDETLTIEQLSKKVVKALSIDSSIVVKDAKDKSSNTKILKIANVFFDIKKSRPQIKGVRVYRYTVNNIDFKESTKSTKGINLDNKYWSTHYSDKYMIGLLADI